MARASRQADEGAGVVGGRHLDQGGGVRRLLGPGDQVGVELPDQRVEPEQRQRQPRQQQEQPVPVADVGQFMGQDGAGGFGPPQALRSDQDHAGRQAPAERRRRRICNQQAGRPGAAEAGKDGRPRRGDDDVRGAGPAVQRPDAQRKATDHQQGSGGPEPSGQGRQGRRRHRRLDGDAPDRAELAGPDRRRARRRRLRRQKLQRQAGTCGHHHGQGQQQADAGAEDGDAAPRRAPPSRPRRDQRESGDEAGADEKIGDRDEGAAHRSRSLASSMARVSASTSSGRSVRVRPSRAVAAVTADPAKKVSTIRRSAPVASASGCGDGR